MIPVLSDTQRRMVESVRRLAQERFRGRADLQAAFADPFADFFGFLRTKMPELAGG